MRVIAARQPRVTSQQQLVVLKTIPAPVGGLNARDPLAAMNSLDAVVLDNWFPRIADCIIRGGCANHVTGFASRPRTLALYTPPTASNKMFASTDTNIYDVTSPGAVGASVAVCTVGYWNWTQMGVSGGHYLMMFNGTDKPKYYDGTNWIAVDGASAPAITGVTTTTLIAATVFKRRLYFVQAAKLNFWYLPVDSVGGAALEFTLGPLCQKGGYTMAINAWSFDGGAGPDDFLAIATSEGELVIFTGSDPADANSFKLVGTFFVGRPIGRKCFQKFGGDLIIITEYGAFPLSKVLLATTVDYKSALTNKIEGAFNTSARTYFSNTGWEAQILPNQAAFIFNVPTTDQGATALQYVMNTTTKMWCSFSGWNASCFAVFNRELYFADSTKITKAWNGHSDYGANIVADAETAFNNFGSASQLKHFKLLRPNFIVDGALTFSMGLAIDFEQNVTLTTATLTPVTGAIWDTSFWDSSYWAAGLEIKSSWRTVASKPGYWAAALVRVATNSLEVHWVSEDYTYQTGGII